MIKMQVSVDHQSYVARIPTCPLKRVDQLLFIISYHLVMPQVLRGKSPDSRINQNLVPVCLNEKRFQSCFEFGPLIFSEYQETLVQGEVTVS